MKVLIISDSHGNKELVTKVKERHSDEVNAIIHCGDSELPKNSSEMNDFLAVRGNCDYDTLYPEVLVEDIETTRLLITHGHLHQVKTTLMPLKYKAEEVNANIVCFGHSHIAGAEMVDHVLFINPGSILLPRMTTKKTYVILEVTKTEYIVHYYNDLGDIVQSYTFNKHE